MSTFQPSYQENSQPYYPRHLHQPTQEDKPHHDDLIDEYASPYAKTSHHQTFAVEASPSSPTEHRRRPSFPASKISYSSDYTKESSDVSNPSASRVYPPLPTAKDATPVKETDSRSLWQKIVPESWACRLYVLTVLVQTAIDLGIEGDILIRINQAQGGNVFLADNSMGSRKMPVYLSIFALAHVFQFIMAVDAVYARNTLQFICLTMFNALFLLYAIIQIGEIRTIIATTEIGGGISDIPINVLTTIIPIVISVAEVAYIALGWKIYHEFGWKVYKFLGADRNLKKMYASYQIFECLVKFDVFFWVGFSVQFIWLVLNNNDWEYYLTCAALPLSVVLLIEGHLAARHENKWMMATFMSGCVGAMVYFIYKLFKVVKYHDTIFKHIASSLTTFSVIAIILLLLTFIFAVIVMRNFGRGLKDAFERKRNPPGHTRFASQSPHQRSASKTLNRMSID